MADAGGMLLGLADSAFANEEELNADWSTNKFGGAPKWMPHCLPNCHPKCQICDGLLHLVAQVYCPLEGDEHHRTLHVFGCLKKVCRKKPGSWSALRSQFIEKNQTRKNEKQQMDAKIVQETWCHDADDWGSGDGSKIKGVDMSFGKMTIKEKPTEMEAESDCGEVDLGTTRKALHLRLQKEQSPCFTPFHVHVVEESTLHTSDTFDYEIGLLREYEAREGPLEDFHKESPTSGYEKYEKTVIADGDKMFHKFKKQIQACKEQCLRYQWNGKPLLLSEKVKPSQPLENVPVCGNCGSERIFEMQLMPALASLLQSKASESEESKEGPNGACFLHDETRMDFGTIFIYTCKNSCNKAEGGNSIPLEEVVIAQPSPDSEMFDKIVN